MNVRHKIPLHVAIIMDGNGRWARRKGLPRIKGHEKGADSVRETMKACSELGVKYLTLYAFSVENWSRPRPEIDGIMTLLTKFLGKYERDLHERGIRLRAIGRIEDLRDDARRELARVESATKDYDSWQLILALSYGGRTEIARAARRLAEQSVAGDIRPEDIDEDAVARNLYAPDIPDPDLLIRTSGEMRISNFLLWQISYAELYVTDTLWPDFGKEEFAKAIEEYGKRDRRYGRVASGRGAERHE